MSCISKNKLEKDDCEKQEIIRFPDGTFELENPHLRSMQHDFLYHLALGTATHDLIKMFGDVKFVCMGGSNSRMESFANHIMKEIDYELPPGATLEDISKPSDRFCLYKIGPVLSVSHGMGISSISILLHEMIKLMHHVKAKDPVFIRIGTCGGIGIEPGTVVVSDGAVDAMLRTDYEIPILGKLVKRPAVLDRELANELKSLADPSDDFQTVCATTMAASDFYEEQGRLDGAFCNYQEEDKMKFLQNLYDNGVRNIEMECVPFGALTHQAGIKSAIVCVSLINRLDGDQLLTPKHVIKDFQVRPQKIVSRFIRKRLGKATM